MKAGAAALFAAVCIHAAILLFGGLLFFHAPAKEAVREDVEILQESADRKDDQKKEEPEEAQAPAEAADSEALDEKPDALPDLRELEKLESGAQGPAALDALSLSDLESALNGTGGVGAFADGVRLTSGGRIGGTGVAGGDEEQDQDRRVEETFSIAELDQRPRAVFQAVPAYPSELRRRKIGGTVHVAFLVDRDGKVLTPAVEKSTNASLDKPALDAVRRWTFEPGTRNGEKVRFKMRVPITFNLG